MRQDESLTEQRYFHLYGLKSVAPEALNCALEEAINELEVALYGPSRTELTDAEIAMLERAGVDIDERPDDTDPMLDYAVEFAAIRATSLTPATVAERLGVTPLRIRQMIRDGNLYAMRIEGRLHLPIFQLTARALVPNIGRVNQEITDLDPVSAQRWLTTADPDLEDFTPLNWLKAGRDVDTVLKVVPER
ncbi:MAG: hypothetical protein OXS50_06565 [Gammaproteobacteria bacterium]|nr:hypothetical protein [Gammaproteobacteria bacterium]